MSRGLRAELMPRSGRSSCIELTPMSRQHAVDVTDTEAFEHALDVSERRAHGGEAVAEAPSRSLASDSAVGSDRYRSPAAELGEQRFAVAARPSVAST